MRCRDIADDDFLAALDPGAWTSIGVVMERLGDLPFKLVLAKARILIDRKGVMHGCPCGCRGDFHRASECVWGC